MGDSFTLLVRFALGQGCDCSSYVATSQRRRLNPVNDSPRQIPLAVERPHLNTAPRIALVFSAFAFALTLFFGVTIPSPLDYSYDCVGNRLQLVSTEPGSLRPARLN